MTCTVPIPTSIRSDAVRTGALDLTVPLPAAGRSTTAAGRSISALAVRRFGAPMDVEIVLVLDVSGSMAGPKLDQASVAASALVRAMAPLPSARAAVVTFHDTAQVRNPLEPVGLFAAQYEPLNQSEIGDGTSIYAGLDEADVLLTPEARGTAQLILLMSDGMNTGEEPFTLADDLKRRGVTIVTVGFGGPGDIDHDTLRRMASNPALFYGAYDGNALRDLFHAIGKTITQTVRAGVHPRSRLTTL